MRFVTLIAAAALTASTFAHSQMMTPSYGGLWWKSPAASEAGWGLNITHQGDILFATWFTYDRDGNGMWLVIPQANLLPNIDYDPYYGGYGMSTGFEYAGAIYRTTGPAFDSANFNPASVTVTQAGTASIKFTSENFGTFMYTVDGVSGSKVITKQAYSSMPTCDFVGPRGANFQDLWWRSPAGSESGWGVNLTHQGDIIFATWFTYDSAGKGMWMVMSDARRTATNTYSGALYRTNGPAFDSVWDGSKVRATQVGTGTLTFTDANNGSFAYTVNGVSQSKPITRQVFANPATVCR